MFLFTSTESKLAWALLNGLRAVGKDPFSISCTFDNNVLFPFGHTIRSVNPSEHMGTANRKAIVNTKSRRNDF